jgi:hypothetical protein
MKAVAVFPGSHEVKLIEQEVPRISQPDQVMLRMLDIGGRHGGVPGDRWPRYRSQKAP